MRNKSDNNNNNNNNDNNNDNKQTFFNIIEPNSIC